MREHRISEYQVSKMLFLANIFSVGKFYNQANINRCKERKTA
nr:MAG TPA: hypothetical protein [Bacteriophage sp.]